MATVVESLTQLLQSAADSVGLEATIPPVNATKSPELGDYQSNCCFRLAKAAKTSPRELAAKLAAALPIGPVFAKVEVAGPGFLNLFLTEAYLGQALQAQFSDPKLHVPQTQGTVVIDYSSPNVAKRMHVGHLRSTVIGGSLHKLYDFCGWTVVADNHIGDWGTQFGKLIVSWDAWVEPEAFEQDPIGELQRIYVKFSQDATEAQQDMAREETAKLQAGDERNLALWRRFIDASMVEFESIYTRLGVSFDVTYGESHYNDMLQPLVDSLLEQGVAEESDGAVIIPFDKSDGKGLKDQPFLIRKRDGAALYGTTDLATVRFRLDTWAPDRVLYVTDTRQQLHFKQLFAAAKKLGWNQSELWHVWFGLLSLPEGNMSSRAGNVINLKDLLDAAVAKAREIVDDKSAELSEQERAMVAEAVGVSAVRYADLSQNPQANVVFDWDKMMAMDGNTAPFLMYGHARLRSIQRKEGLEHAVTAHAPVNEAERQLSTLLLRFPDVVPAALDASRPSIVAEYLFTVARAVNRFYSQSRIKGSVGEERAMRASLVAAASMTLSAGLGLLGIPALERM